MLAVGCAAGLPVSAQDQTPSVVTLPGVTVTAQELDDARSSIQPSLGATRYEFTRGVIDSVPLGQQAPLNQVLLRAPGVVQDSFGQVHIRGDHSNNQYRLDGVQLPEGLSVFNQVLATQYANKMSLLTGTLPAQYGFRNAGIVDIEVKSGRTAPGAEASMTLGTYNWQQPAFSYGGSSGKWDWFATGQFVHNSIGIENPEPWPTATSDDTEQWRGLFKVSNILDDSTRLSFIGGGAHARYQIPQRSSIWPRFTVLGNQTYNSASLNQQQWEDTFFGMASLQKKVGDVDLQISAFGRSSNLTYQPDAIGDLMYNGISPWANRNSLAFGLQTDASWKVAPRHTVRGGFMVQRERATTITYANVLPVDANGDPTTDVPSGIAYGSDQTGWTFGVYLQDEWRITPTLTLNFGARFDLIDAPTQENQISPRANLVWQANEFLTAHIGYARYFTPPQLGQVSNAAIWTTLGSTARPEVLTNDPVLAERMHYFAGGFEVRPLDGLKLGFDAYYKIVNNLIDKGQFGSPVFLTPFNYADANVKGIELTGSYDKGPWSIYGNLAWSEARGTSINSGQYNHELSELNYIAQNYVFLEHDQGWTASAGMAYTFNQGSDWATRVSGDIIYGN
ncbi:MAG: TonB-dependent receptor, partial [Acidimicrobiia bacterium]